MQETLPSGLKLILAVQMICQAKLIHLASSIDYSFIVSALALRCKEFIKFYNWNVQRMMQKLKIKMDSYFRRTGYLNIEQ